MTENYVKALHIVLADTYTLYLKTQNYHWNVEGERFKSLHELFELQYTELAAAVDEIAERIRALGEKVDGTYEGFAKLRTLDEAKMDISDVEMVQDLFESNKQVVASLQKAREVAEDADDQVTVDMAIGRTAVHEKAAWMLRSSLPEAFRKKADSAASYQDVA